MAETLDKTISEIADSFESFKAQQAAKIDQLETRLARPGQAHNSPAAADATGNRNTFVDTQTGETLLAIKAGDNVGRKMADKGIASTPSNDTLADFCKGVAGMKAHGELSKKALAAGTDSTGGYLLPTEVFSGVLQAMTAESTVMQAGASVVMLGGAEGSAGAKSYDFAAISTIPTASWRAEAGNVLESDPAFRNVRVVPRSLAFYFKVSRELLADAANLNQAMLLACSQAFAKELDRVALLGTGTAPEPRGLLNTVGIQPVTNGAAGTSLATIKFSNLFSAAQAILNADGPMPTAAIMSHRTRIGLAQLVASDGQPLQVPPMLQDIRQLSTSQIPNNLTVGASTDCSNMYVGDFSYLGYAMREGVSVRAMEETFATTGQIGFFCHARVDVFVTYPAVFAAVTGIRP